MKKFVVIIGFKPPSSALRAPSPASGRRKILANESMVLNSYTWLKTKNIDDAFIQPYSGHVKRDSLEIYSKLSLANAQDKYNDVIGGGPV
ncbi:MAG: hypothetical protein NTU48_09600 [Legionellales bacterium]|nr:hypothetical protein [Legionellales bacterium]